MDLSLSIFASSAAAIGFIHTVMGIDHYLPFLVLGKAQGWSLRKHLGISFLCGLGHVLSSVVLGVFGVGLGFSLQRMEFIHRVQGNLAAWFLILFGLTYAGWALARGRRLQRHAHEHGGGKVHAHVGNGEMKAAVVTTWTLFVIFVLGPCEPLIPLMIVPALKTGLGEAMKVAAVFGATTVVSMVGLVTLGYYGINRVTLGRLQVHANALAGLAIAISGLAIRVFGI